MTIATGTVGVLVVLAIAGLVYRDASRIGVGRPAAWAALVCVTTGGALVGFLAVPTVPVPGLLAVAIAGPLLYLFERDDARHGDEPADPHTLADAPTRRSGPAPGANESGTGTDGNSRVGGNDDSRVGGNDDSGVDGSGTDREGNAGGRNG